MWWLRIVTQSLWRGYGKPNEGLLTATSLGHEEVLVSLRRSGPAPIYAQGSLLLHQTAAGVPVAACDRRCLKR
jgi:hypothetical protein